MISVFTNVRTGFAGNEKEVVESETHFKNPPKPPFTKGGILKRGIIKMAENDYEKNQKQETI